MAKVIGPLMSVGASGKFANSIVFGKNGTAREYVVPANPNTAAQQAVRNLLKDVQAQLTLLGPVLRAELRAQFGARWNALIIKELTKNAGAAVTTYETEYNAFQAGEKTAWAGADTAVKVDMVDGLALYAVASAVYDMGVRLGVTLTLAQPAAGNATTVAANWTAAA